MRRSQLLTRVFLRRFLENDLISPETDHMQVVSAVVGGLFGSGMVVTVFMSLKYMGPFPSPGRAALLDVGDQFLFCAWAMLVMAVVALVEWEALGFDARDSIILGQLPISRAAIVLAKLRAILLFASIFLASVTLIPAVLHPASVFSSLPAGLTTVAAVFGAQFVSSLGAGLFGFSAALAAREAVHAVLGARLFRRVSRALQAALLTLCATMVLLMPLASPRTLERVAHERTAPSVLPPDWFVALYEVVGGHLIAEAPTPSLPPRIATIERRSSGVYRAASPAFVILSRRALGSLLIACVLAIGGFAWNARRLAPQSLDRRRGRASRWANRAGAVFLPRNPTTRAGFQFAARTLARSLNHRMAMIAAVAAAMAGSLVVIHATVDHVARTTPTPVVLAMQPFTVAVLLAAFRHAIRLPAEVRAAWCVPLVWQGRVREYFAGVKRAALTWIVLPAAVVFLPVYTWMIDWRAAAWLAAFGFLLGCVLLDALLLGQRTLPFITEHVASENFNTRGPLYLLGLLAGAYWFGAIEQAALSSVNGAITLALILVACVLVVRVADARRRQGTWAGLEFEPEGKVPTIIQ
jgi:hypothetical protein